MTARTAFDNLLKAARDWHAALPALSDFVPWPDDLRYAQRDPVALPVLDHLPDDPGDANNFSLPLRNALVAVAPFAEWRLTYTEEEVGRDFLNRFGWFELAGPDGHFISQQARLTVGYWGPNLNYDRHQHEPEELYSVVSGSADFYLDGAETLTLGPGDTRFHPSNHPHALITRENPVLTFVLWRGAGLADPPRMTR